MTSVNPKSFIYLILIFSLGLFSCQQEDQPKESIPLPEHPRPDFERADWINLNGYWEFEFDGSDEGIKESWYSGQKVFTPIFDPFNRPVQLHGQPRYEHFFRVKHQYLGAKTAANKGGDNPHLALCQAQH